jgi:hypothetical protein
MGTIDYKKQQKGIEPTININKVGERKCVDISGITIKDVLVTSDVNDDSLWNVELVFKATKHI